MTPETLNEMYFEEMQYQAWCREMKNTILAMTDTKKKQARWVEVFGTKQESDDSYLAGDIF